MKKNKIPLTLLKAKKIPLKDLNIKKVKKISVTQLQSDYVNAEPFYKPISKLIPDDE